MASSHEGPRAAGKPRPPLKPILLRKPASVLGNRARDDEGSPDSEQRPAKRVKTVAFDEALNTVKQIGSKTLQEVKALVKKALEDHAKGDDSDYDELRDVFSAERNKRRKNSDTQQQQELLLYVLALTSCTPMLSRCSDLVKDVLGCNWLTRDDDFAKAFVQFLASFVSAQGSSMTLVLSKIIDTFADTGSSMRAPAGYPQVKKSVVKERLHLALRYMVKLFPNCEPLLLQQIETRFPSSEDSAEQQVEYVDNLLLLREYTKLDRDILELITKRCCEIDMEMQLDLQDDTDDTVIQIMADLQALQAERDDMEATVDEETESDEDEDDEDDDDSDADSTLSDESGLEDLTRLTKIRIKIQSMDAILDRLFMLYTQELVDVTSAKAENCFEGILADFVNIVLVRYKSRHTQFILFWAAQKAPAFSGRFIGCLLSIITGDNSHAALVKRTAVSFLAGFVSRAAQVTRDEVRTVVSCLLDYMDYFRLKFEPGCKGPDVLRYPVFYAFFQGLLYIFCFRWRDLVTNDDSSFVDPDDIASYQRTDLTWIDGLQSRLKECVGSPLNPLKVCAPVIVQEFARLAQTLDLIYVYSRLETNKSVSLSSVMSNTYSTGGALRESGAMQEERSAPLQAEFPFDPYLLPLSKRWLEKENLYIHWHSLPHTGGRPDDEEDDDSEAEDSEVEEDDVGGADQESDIYDS